MILLKVLLCELVIQADRVPKKCDFGFTLISPTGTRNRDFYVAGSPKAQKVSAHYEFID